MDAKTLEGAINSAKDAAEKSKDYKAETYAAVLLFELMRSTVAQPRNRYELPPETASHLPRKDKPYSSAELFASKSWNTEVDKVVVASFYLERFSGSTSYTIEEIRNCLVGAKVALPKNINLAILQAVQKGFMMEVPQQGGPRKTWALTQTGERRVEEMNAGKVSSHGDQ